MHNTYICLQHHSILLIIIYIYYIYVLLVVIATAQQQYTYSHAYISTHDCILCSILFSLNIKLKMQTCHETCNTRWLAYISSSLTHFLRSACQLIRSRMIIVITCELHNDNKWLFDSTFIRILTLLLKRISLCQAVYVDKF